MVFWCTYIGGGIYMVGSDPHLLTNGRQCNTGIFWNCLGAKRKYHLGRMNLQHGSRIFNLGSEVNELPRLLCRSSNDIMWMARFSLGLAVTGGSPAGGKAGVECCLSARHPLLPLFLFLFSLIIHFLALTISFNFTF